MGVIVVGNVSHPVIHKVIELKVLRDDIVEARMKHCLHRIWRNGMVDSPDDHWNRAEFTLGDPAHVIGVIPRRHTCRLAQITTGNRLADRDRIVNLSVLHVHSIGISHGCFVP